MTEPTTQGVDAAKLEAAIEYLRTHSGRDGARQLVVVRNGYLIWQGDQADKIHGIWSCTKSFTSTCLGLLIDDGKCKLDTPAKDFVPAMAQTYPKVSLRHFATMTSGYRAVGDEPRGGYLHGPSQTPLVPGPKPLFPPGSHYAYWDSAMNQFANVLSRIAGEPLDQLFKRRVADPIGMNPNEWRWGDYGESKFRPPPHSGIRPAGSRGRESTDSTGGAMDVTPTESGSGRAPRPTRSLLADTITTTCLSFPAGTWSSYASASTSPTIR